MSESGGNDKRLLPKTRWGLFAMKLKDGFFDLVAVSLFCFLFHAPLFLWLILSDVLALLDASSLASALLVYGICAPLWAVAGLGTAGALYVAKRMSFGEGEDTKADFFLGIKEGVRTAIPVYSIIGVLYFVLKIDAFYLVLDESLDYLARISLLGVGYGLFFVFLVPLFFALAQRQLYEVSLWGAIINGWKLFFGTFIASFPMCLLFSLPFFLAELLPYLVAQLVVYGILALFGYGLIAFGFALYANYVFDKTINKNQFPGMIRKGLAPLDEN